MRTLLVGGAFLLVAGVQTLAADLAIAPPSIPVVPSWTGFYIGVHAGAGWQSSSNPTFSDPTNGFYQTTNLAGSAALGGVGGIHAGYNWQFAPAWVVGFEGDLSWTSLSDQRTAAPLITTAAFGGAPFPNSSVAMSANIEWLSSARAKLGYVGWWNTMFYATGGVAWANVEYSGQLTVAPVAGFANSVIGSTSFTTTKSGYVVGGGAEWQATANILLRAEYLFYSINQGANGSATQFPVPPLNAPVIFTWSSYNVQVFRIAGSYKF
jgi:outer membrane immunogenic protein